MSYMATEGARLLGAIGVTTAHKILKVKEEILVKWIQGTGAPKAFRRKQMRDTLRIPLDSWEREAEPSAPLHFQPLGERNPTKIRSSDEARRMIVMTGELIDNRYAPPELHLEYVAKHASYVRMLHTIENQERRVVEMIIAEHPQWQAIVAKQAEWIATQPPEVQKSYFEMMEGVHREAVNANV